MPFRQSQQARKPDRKLFLVQCGASRRVGKIVERRLATLGAEAVDFRQSCRTVVVLLAPLAQSSVALRASWCFATTILINPPCRFFSQSGNRRVTKECPPAIGLMQSRRWSSHRSPNPGRRSSPNATARKHQFEQTVPRIEKFHHIHYRS